MMARKDRHLVLSTADLRKPMWRKHSICILIAGLSFSAGVGASTLRKKVFRVRPPARIMTQTRLPGTDGVNMKRTYRSQMHASGQVGGSALVSEASLHQTDAPFQRLTFTSSHQNKPIGNLKSDLRKRLKLFNTKSSLMRVDEKSTG